MLYIAFALLCLCGVAVLFRDLTVSDRVAADKLHASLAAGVHASTP